MSLNLFVVNGRTIVPPTEYVAYVAYGDTSNPANFVVVYRIVQSR